MMGGTDMDQIKTGLFIAEQRKALGYTQAQLAEIIGVSDRAISKWERGKGMPDVSLMLSVCDALHISVNDLLCGEKITDDSIRQKSDENIIGIVKNYKKRSRLIFLVMLMVFFFATLYVSVVLSDRYVTRLFMNTGTQLCNGFEDEIRAMQEKNQGMAIFMENIPSYIDSISEEFELLNLPICILLMDKERTVIAKTDIDEKSNDYQLCYEQALKGNSSMYSSGKEISYVKSFEYQGESYVVSVYSSHNQFCAAIQSEFFLFALLVAGICLIGILGVYMIADKLWLSTAIK